MNRYKEYIIHYKVFSLPWWYSFSCYADSADSAVSMFLRENPIGIESYKITDSLEICPSFKYIHR